MIVPDVNLLLYANNPAAIEYAEARKWIQATFTGNEAVGFCWPVVCGFLRVSTSSRALLDPLDMTQAVDLVEDWISRPQVSIILPTETHWTVLRRLLAEGRISGPATTDAEIASYAVEYGATLHTADRGFARFSGLKMFNPLTS